MKKANVLIEVKGTTPSAFALHAASVESDVDAVSRRKRCWTT